MPILQMSFCRVISPCITKMMHWSPPAQRAETNLVPYLLWGFGFSSSAILKIFVWNSYSSAWLGTDSMSLFYGSIISLFYWSIICIWHVWMAVNFKNMFCSILGPIINVTFGRNCVTLIECSMFQLVHVGPEWGLHRWVVMVHKLDLKQTKNPF